jgi:hypothetical protein
MNNMMSGDQPTAVQTMPVEKFTGIVVEGRLRRLMVLFNAFVTAQLTMCCTCSLKIFNTVLLFGLRLSNVKDKHCGNGAGVVENSWGMHGG